MFCTDQKRSVSLIISGRCSVKPESLDREKLRRLSLVVVQRCSRLQVEGNQKVSNLNAMEHLRSRGALGIIDHVSLDVSSNCKNATVEDYKQETTLFQYINNTRFSIDRY